jgi:hypothetical protein
MISIEKLSVEKLRTLIPDSDKLPDAEIEGISQIMYNFANDIFNRWLTERNKTKKGHVLKIPTYL